YYTYTPGGSWELTAIPESQKVRTNSQQVNQITGAIVTGSDLNLSPLFSSNGLVGYWKFDEGQGTSTQDSSGNGNTGTWNGTLGSQWATGEVGGAGQFNGSNDWVNAGNGADLNPTSAMTISTWVKFTNLNRETIASKWGASGNSDYSWLLFANMWSSGEVNFLTSSDGTGYTNARSSAGAVATGVWYYIAGVYSGANTTATLYINGAFAGSSTAPSSLKVSTTSLSIGADHDNGVGEPAYRLFNGLIDDVRIYNRALSAAEIMSLYNATK
ncbi:MAG TPA: LamG domain-containing protein, partial [Candidatus Paceibacterota bacterium]|nr:LamG domain-containing protein [Candidatus Paceibacterota bacterium]